MITAACVTCGLIAAGCAACVWCAMDGPGAARLRRAARYWPRLVRYHLLRRRYARRMRGPLPARDQDIPYDRWKWLAVLDAWEAPAASDERSRT